MLQPKRSLELVRGRFYWCGNPWVGVSLKVNQVYLLEHLSAVFPLCANPHFLILTGHRRWATGLNRENGNNGDD